MKKDKIYCEVCKHKCNLNKQCYCPQCGHDIYEQYWLEEIERRKNIVRYEQHYLNLAKFCLSKNNFTRRQGILESRFDYYKKTHERRK